MNNTATWNLQSKFPIWHDAFRGVVITKDGYTYAGLVVSDERSDRKIIQCFPPHHRSRDIVTVDIANIYVWMVLPAVLQEATP